MDNEPELPDDVDMNVVPDDAEAVVFSLGSDEDPWTSEQIEEFISEFDADDFEPNAVAVQGDIEVETIPENELRGESCPVCHTPWERTELTE